MYVQWIVGHDQNQYPVVITWHSNAAYVKRFVAKMYSWPRLNMLLFTETFSFEFPFNNISTVSGRPRPEKYRCLRSL